LPLQSQPPEGTRRLSRFGNLVCIGALFALVPLLVYYLDGSMRAYILSVREQRGMAMATAVSLLGYGLLNGGIAAVLLAVGYFGNRPREAKAGWLGLLSVISGGLAVNGLKLLFCRARPLAEAAGQFFAVFPCVGEGYTLMSFPSGHSVTSFALAYVLARTYPRASPLFYALAVMVALSRVYLASHFLSDVVAGAAIGLLAGWMVCRLAHFPLGDARR
jgi:membrane-associated phospholipid phosphatase